MKNNIILIGYMGCGKSTVGKKIAELLNMPFLDTDQWIEEKEEMPVSEIFALKTEAYFRDLETNCLKVLLQEEKEQKAEECINNQGLEACNRKVISVGGGLPVREENRKLLKQLGQVIYLKANPETIYERLKGDSTRPLLQTENPLQKIKEMIADREEKYQAAAERVIYVDGKSVTEIIEEIIGKQGTQS